MRGWNAFHFSAWALLSNQCPSYYKAAHILPALIDYLLLSSPGAYLCFGSCWFGTSANWTPRSFLTCEAVWVCRQESPNLKRTPHSTLTWRYSSWPYQVIVFLSSFVVEDVNGCSNAALAMMVFKLSELICIFSLCSFLLLSLRYRPQGESSRHVRREVQAV